MANVTTWNSTMREIAADRVSKQFLLLQILGMPIEEDVCIEGRRS